MTPAEPLPSGLRWTCDEQAGFRRRRAGRGFVYLGAGGRPLRDERALDRIRALAIPPAWTDVWICADAGGHLQATGRDAKGRKQYRYHPDYRAHREETKFGRLREFGDALPAIRKRVAHDMTAAGMPREKVLATVVRLLEATLVRVGNEEYARSNGSYGLTTLRDQHARFTDDGVRLVFKGKHGIAADIAVADRRLRRIVQRCQDLPGQLLFQYIDDDGEPRPVTSTDVNDYLRETTGLPITAKDFRTWMGTLLAAVAFAELPPPRSAAAAKRATARVLEVVAANLGNTPAVCRASYVHPVVIDRFTAGAFADDWNAAPARGSRLLIAEERRLLALLRRTERHRGREHAPARVQRSGERTPRSRAATRHPSRSGGAAWTRSTRSPTPRREGSRSRTPG